MPASYTDPYASQQGTGAGRPYDYHPQQSESMDFNTYNNYPHQTYDNMGPSYDPYASATNYTDDEPQQQQPQSSQQPQHSRTYGSGEGAGYPPARQRTVRIGGKKKDTPVVSVIPVRKQWNGFDQGEFTPVTTRPKNKTARALREYRFGHQGNLWTKGGRGRCIGRFLCCTVMIAVLLIVGVALSLALWIRPPSVSIGDVVTQNTTGSLASADGLSINLSVDISVNNPNYFGVDFKQIKAEIFYPINNTLIGGGEANDIVFQSRSQTNFTFPFALQYKTSLDPGNKIFVDLGTKCGIGGGAKSNIVVDYKITLGIRILLITISPVVSNKFSFACPSSIANAGGVITGTTS